MSGIGVVFGRFQIVHLGYIEYILSAKRRCDELIIGISNPDSKHLLYNRYQTGCLRERMNPFSYLERMEMIEEGLADFGVHRNEYNIVPFPLDDPRALASYIPEDAVIYMTVFDEWGREKKAALEKFGYKVEVMKYAVSSEKTTTSSKVLKSMGYGERWGRMVPKGVEKYILQRALDERVRELWKQIEDDDNSDSAFQIKYSVDYERERFERNASGFSEREPSIDELSRRYDQEIWDQARVRTTRKELDLI